MYSTHPLTSSYKKPVLSRSHAGVVFGVLPFYVYLKRIEIWKHLPRAAVDPFDAGINFPRTVDAILADKFKIHPITTIRYARQKKEALGWSS